MRHRVVGPQERPRSRIRNRGSKRLGALCFRCARMRRIGLTHSGGNEASRRIAERLGFSFEGIQRDANLLPGGKNADRYCYARFDVAGLPDLEVQWHAIRVITALISPCDKQLWLKGRLTRDVDCSLLLTSLVMSLIDIPTCDDVAARSELGRSLPPQSSVL